MKDIKEMRMVPDEFELGGLFYDRIQSEGLRQELIKMRDEALMQLPNTSYSVIIMSHVIGWMHQAMDIMWPEEKEMDG